MTASSQVLLAVQLFGWLGAYLTFLLAFRHPRYRGYQEYRRLEPEQQMLVHCMLITVLFFAWPMVFGLHVFKKI